jgi:tight adherence protein B
MTHLFGNEYAVIIGVGAAVFVFIYVNAEAVLGILKEQSLGQREYVIQKLDLMFVEIDRKKITLAMLLSSFGMGVLILLVLWPNITAGLPLAALFIVVGWKIPRILIDAAYTRRASRFVDQMVDGLGLMSNGVKTGLSTQQAMKLVSDNMPNPISQEFKLMLDQITLGQSLEDVLNDLARRIPYSDVQMFVTAVNILKETGGNTAEVFDNISKTIRERIKVEKKIAAVTAQGVMQGAIITVMPFILLVLFYFMDPDFIAPMFNQTLGWFLLGLMLVLQIIGGILIRKIVRIKV